MICDNLHLFEGYAMIKFCDKRDFAEIKDEMFVISVFFFQWNWSWKFQIFPVDKVDKHLPKTSPRCFDGNFDVHLFAALFVYTVYESRWARETICSYDEY